MFFQSAVRFASNADHPTYHVARVLPSCRMREGWDASRVLTPIHDIVIFQYVDLFVR